MPYSVPVLSVVMEGTTFPGEGFAIGLKLAATGGGNIGQAADLAPYVEACQEWFARPSTGISAAAALTTVKVNLLGLDGKYASPNDTALVDLTTPVTGSGGGVPHPQLSACVSFTTAALRGIASMGRIYPPLSTAGAGSQGRITAADCLAMANSAATLINELNAIGDGRVVIASKGGLTGAPAVRAVTGVRVGNVIDVQRRRRGSMKEIYTPATTVVTDPS